jgi:hypothetical protein
LLVRYGLPVVMLLVWAASARAGLHYSGESTAELPSRWRGFLIDHRSLRSAGFEKPGNLPPSPLRDEYLAAARKLEQAAANRPLTADELADLGALYVRLGRPEKAVELLRPAAGRFSNHFRIAANLGTAWQLAGDLEQASFYLENAVQLAPEKLRDFEWHHLKLVRLRLKEGRAAAKPEAVDDLFGARYVAESGNPEPGQSTAGETRNLLQSNAPAVVQQLALWLPADGRLLWQAGEIANAFGDVRTAATILDGCVSEFGMGAADLRKRRQIYRAAVDRWKDDHDVYRGTLAFKSPRPLVRTLDESTLPPIRPDRPTPLGWPVLGATTFGDGKPAFPKYLEKLDGRPVTMLGYVQTIGSEARAGRFLLLEYPVGCWFCETPEPTGLVSVELKGGTPVESRKGLVKVTGTLVLNREDPEGYLFRITDARLGDAE